MNDDNKIAWVIIIAIVILAFLGLGFVVYVYIKYGNTPITELPAWVIPFFMK